MHVKRLWFVVCLLAGCLAFSYPAMSQSVTGTISGLVTDSNGGAVANAAVSVKSEEQGTVVRTLTTNAEGQYVAAAIPAGYYTLTVEKPGFKKSVKSRVKLNANDSMGLNFTLEVGAITETVSVTVDRLHVETQSVAATGLITPTEIRQIPLNTRNYEQLVTLMPGVSNNSSDQLYLGISNPSGSTNTVNFAIGGQRNSANNWTVDGADNVDRGSNLTLLTYPSVDAIAEFKVLRGQYEAEYGRAAAGQINVVTKSGGNQFHGDAYEFFRNDKLAANNFFNNRNKIARPPLRYNDFGYTIGGPVLIPHVYNENRDKTFFFFSQEFRRVITYGTLTATIPTPGMLQGTFAHNVCVSRDSSGVCNAPLTNQVTSIDPVAQAYITDIFSKIPAPNAGGTTLVSALRNQSNARQELFRVDQNFSPKLSLSVRYIHDAIPTIEPAGLFTNSPLPGVSTTETNSPGYSWMARATSAFSSTLLNEGGFFFSYGAITSNPTGLISPANSPDINVTLPSPSTLARVPALVFNGGGSSITGFGPYRDFNRNYNVFDNVTKSIGRHIWKFGFVYNRYQKTENAGGLNAGQFSFTNAAPAGGATDFEQSWADFLTGHVSTFTQAQADLTPDIRQNEFDVYAQDQFRMRKNLTLSLGVRYSRYGEPVDKSNTLSNFDPASFDPAKAPTIDSNGNICTTAPCAGGGVPNPNFDPLNGIIIAGQNSPFGDNIAENQNKDFAPRIGVAWDPFGDGKTSVRAGYGIFYDSTLVGIYEQNIFTNPPFAPNAVITNTELDNPAAGVPANSTPVRALRGTPLPSHTPYSQQWSLDIQRQVLPTFAIDAGYFASNGVHLLGIVDINQVMPGAGVAAGFNPAGTTVFNSGATPKLNALRPYLGYNAINVVESGFNSNYNSFQFAAKKRWGRNSLLNIYYTWSHNLTDNQSDRSTAAQNIYDIAAEYGPTQFDRRQILTADFVYDLPWLHEQRGVVGHVAGGWTVSGIVSYSSGAPVTITTGGVDPAGLGFLGASQAGGRPDANGNPNTLATNTIDKFFDTSVFSLVPNGDIRAGNAGRGIVLGPGLERWDISFMKDIRLPWESTGLQFRGEMFNIFNHTNFDGLGTRFGSSTFGKVLSTRDPRIVQLGLKFNF